MTTAVQRGGDGLTVEQRKLLHSLPPMPKIPSVRWPEMPDAGQGPDKLRNIYAQAHRRAGLRSIRVPFVDQLARALVETMTECDAAMLKHGIKPHAWAEFRIRALRMYEAAITLRSVWSPEKVGDQRQRRLYHVFVRNNGYKGAEQHAEAVALTGRWERMVEDTVQRIGQLGVHDLHSIMQAHFPYPQTYEAEVERVCRLVQADTTELLERARKGEWVW